MNIRQKFGLGIITPLLIASIGCTIINKQKENNVSQTQNDTTTVDTVKARDIFEQYEQAKADSAKGIISADSFQTIKNRFEEEMKYVECGD